MTPENFSAFLKSPNIETVSISTLEKLIEKYPYAQSLRIAFLRRLKTENHPDFEKHLNKTATYASDRNFLRKYINGENIYSLEYAHHQINTEVLETLELMPLELIENEVLVESEKLKIENEVLVENGELEVENEELEVENESLIENGKLEVENEELIENEELEVENESLIEISDNEEVIEQLPEEEMLENNHENVENMQQSTTEKYKEESLDNEIQKLIIDSKKIDYHAPIEEDIDHLIGEDELEGLDDEIEFGFEIDQTIIADDEDISIFDKEKAKHEKAKHDENHKEWSNYGGDKKTDNSEHEKPKKQEDEFDLSPDNIFSEDDLHIEGSLSFLDKKPVAEELEVVDEVPQNAIPLIDFVEDHSSYEYEDAEDFPAEFEEEEAKEESRDNVEKIKAVLSEANTKEAKKAKIKQYLKRISKIPLEEESMISETYADLLAKQGKIERSIRMYQQLILKNPQKKVYFAAKIKELIKSI